jgi:hypothetical protein
MKKFYLGLTAIFLWVLTAIWIGITFGNDFLAWIVGPIPHNPTNEIKLDTEHINRLFLIAFLCLPAIPFWWRVREWGIGSQD